MRRILTAAALCALLGGGLALAQGAAPAPRDPLSLAKRQAEEARARSDLLERQAARATG